MTSLLRITAVTLLAGAIGCTHNPLRPYSGWVASRSENVTVYTDSLVEHRFSQEWLELSYAAYRAVFPLLPARRVEVVYFQAPPERLYRPNDDPTRASWTVGTLPGGGRIGRDGLLVLETRSEHEAARQLAHHFIARALPDAPLWLQVGMSQYLARHRIHYKGGVWVACFGSRAFPNAPGGSKRNVLIPVADLVTADWYQYDRKERYWYAYTAHAFVHFLIHGQGHLDGVRFRRFLDELSRNGNEEEALALAYPHILDDEWDQALTAHVYPRRNLQRLANERALPQGLCFRIPPAHHADHKPQRVPVPEEDIRLVIADLKRVDIFRTHGSWMPPDVAAAEAAKRPPRRAPSTGPTVPREDTPTLRTSPEAPRQQAP
jgi:hypothetical protein